ncbi:hypothetical protein KQI63_10240 [bacterium]|nr:hypothetical protein [bacterium]
MTFPRQRQSWIAFLFLASLLLLPSLAKAEKQAELPKPWWAVDASSGSAEAPSFGMKAETKEYLAKTPPQAFLRSFVLPGWGQRYADRPGRAALFTGVEISIWTGLIWSSQAARQGESDYLAYARQHAGVSGSYAHEYYVNIGNFLNQDEYNTAKRLQRSYDEQYHGSGTWWEWDSDDNRRTFKDLRISADRHGNRVYYMLGGLLLNRVLSAIDAGQGLAKRQKELRKKGGFAIGYDPRVDGPSLTWSGNLGF